MNNYLCKKLSKKNKNNNDEIVNKSYFKLPYIGKCSNDIKDEIDHICSKFCNNLKIDICFSLFKTGSFFTVKDCISSTQKSFVVYSFFCSSCRASYIGETTRHLKSRVEEHLSTGKGSVIHEHISNNQNCKTKCNIECFKIIDSANSEFQLKIKEAIHIALRKPTLNKQIKHERLNIII